MYMYVHVHVQCTCIYVHVHVHVYTYIYNVHVCVYGIILLCCYHATTAPAHLSLHNMQQLLQYHGNALVAQQVRHHAEVHRPHEALVEAGNGGEGVS